MRRCLVTHKTNECTIPTPNTNTNTNTITITNFPHQHEKETAKSLFEQHDRQHSHLTDKEGDYKLLRDHRPVKAATAIISTEACKHQGECMETTLQNTYGNAVREIYAFCHVATTW